jgi:hypothetical protein
MTKTQTLGLIEVTSQRQADNGTVCYHDPIANCDYMSYESGYVRRKYSTKNWRGKTISTIYQLNKKRTVQHEIRSYFTGNQILVDRIVRVLEMDPEKRVEIICAAAVNYRNTRRKFKNELEKRSTLTAIQDEINQYHAGNLTLDMALNGIKELLSSEK